MGMRTGRKVFRDHDIRGVLWQHLATDPIAPTLVLNEFPIQGHSAIADVAVINGEMVGFEIKSDVDTVRRLPDQVESYNDVFDRVYLVTTTASVDRFKPHISNWWGIFVLDDDGSLRKAKEAETNDRLDILCYLDLLYRQELARLARRYGFRGYGRDSKYDLCLRLKRELDRDSLRHEVRETLRRRADWSAHQLRFDGSSICVEPEQQAPTERPAVVA